MLLETNANLSASRRKANGFFGVYFLSLFPLDLNVPLVFASGKIEVLGKPKPTVSRRTSHQVLKMPYMKQSKNANANANSREPKIRTGNDL